MKNLKKTVKTAYSREYSAESDFAGISKEMGYAITSPKPYVNPFRIVRNTVAVAVACLIGMMLVPVGYVFFSGFSIRDTVSRNAVSYSEAQMDILDSATFRALNSISYDPDRQYTRIDDEAFIASVDSFAYAVFSKMSLTKNGLFSPLGLYMNMDMAYLAVGEEFTELRDNLDALLGGTSYSRGKNISLALRNNYHVSQTGHNVSNVQMRQAAFVDHGREVSGDFVSEATKRRAEVYTADLQSPEDLSKIARWASEAVMEENYLLPSDFSTDQYSVLLLLTSLSFESQWDITFAKEDNVDSRFYPLGGGPIETTFMSHDLSTYYYQGEGFVSFSDYYRSGYSIQYFVPNDLEDHILDLLPADFLSISPREEGEYGYVRLYAPRFELVSTNDFTGVLRSLGLSGLYGDTGRDVLSGIYEAGAGLESRLVSTKQKNTISFTEDGTKASSLTWSLGAGSTAPGGNGDEVWLNQPFVYCIRDLDGLPLMLGYLAVP